MKKTKEQKLNNRLVFDDKYCTVISQFGDDMELEKSNNVISYKVTGDFGDGIEIRDVRQITIDGRVFIEYV